MATINLGAIKFNWQGAYDNATAYAVDDVVSSGGNSYICIAATTGNTPPNATYWELMAQAGTNGTNGTDLTTTLTTQGDLVYRDGSGLQRLGAGTAGQVLQTGGAGANPSWGSVSSDYVLLNTTTISGNPSTISIDGFFSATYRNYDFYFDGICPSGGAYLSCRMNVGGTADIHNYYRNASVYGSWNSANATGVGTYSYNFQFNTNGIFLTNDMSSAGTNRGSGKLTLLNPLSTTHSIGLVAQFQSLNNGEQHMWSNHTGGQFINTGTAVSGLTFFFDTGATFNTGGLIKLYGIK